MPDSSRSTKRKHQQTKGRVLQARIPEHLDAELRDRAEQLGMSVSTIVRNVLLHTFNLVEGVVTDSSHIARALTGGRVPATGPDPEATVIGWQEVILNRNGVCEQCNAILQVGQRAAIGVPTTARASLLCQECLAGLSSSNGDTEGSLQHKAVKKRPSGKASTGNKKAAISDKPAGE